MKSLDKLRIMCRINSPIFKELLYYTQLSRTKSIANFSRLSENHYAHEKLALRVKKL